MEMADYHTAIPPGPGSAGSAAGRAWRGCTRVLVLFARTPPPRCNKGRPEAPASPSLAPLAARGASRCCAASPRRKLVRKHLCVGAAGCQPAEPSSAIAVHSDITRGVVMASLRCLWCLRLPRRRRGGGSSGVPCKARALWRRAGKTAKLAFK